MVRACFSSAKINKKGRRYTKQWVYECLLMRIKSRKLYEYLRSHEILVLPHIDTLNKYVKWTVHMDLIITCLITCLLRTKAEQMAPAERRGILLLQNGKL